MNVPAVFFVPLYCGASVHYARSLKTVAEDLQKVKATILLGVPLLYDKMFRKIYKAITEDKVKSKVVPPLLKITNFAEKVGWKSSKKIVFKELHNTVRWSNHGFSLLVLLPLILRSQKVSGNSDLILCRVMD